jgi:dTDP-4-dehydrorhamnose 3,5-epimerase
MTQGLINKIVVSPLKRIHHPDGDILRGLKATDAAYAGFGEAYFSSIKHESVKGWKKHNQMVSNLLVPVGQVLFIFYDQQRDKVRQIEIGDNNYSRITAPPGLWMAFCGVGKGLNLILNVASIPHDPDESEAVPISTFQVFGK